MKSYRMRASTRQAGFTLVELVIVITILGVLAAVALPRFTNLQSDARAAKAAALYGSVRAAAAQVKATAVVKAKDCANADIAAASGVKLEGTDIALAYCYPKATASNGIMAAANIDATKDGVTFDNTTAGTVILSVNGAPGTCTVTYTIPGAADEQPTITLNAVASPAGTGC